MPHPSVIYLLCVLLSVTAPVGRLCIKHQNLSFHGKFKSKWPSVYLVSYFFSGRLPLGTSEGGRGSGRREGARGVVGAEVVGRLSERVKACSQTVGEGFAVHSYRCL